jgi:signal transduction histidine kinase
MARRATGIGNSATHLDNLYTIQAMTEAVYVGLGILIGVVVGWFLRGGGKAPAPGEQAREELSAFLEALRKGEVSGPGAEEVAGGGPLAELRTILLKEWVPRGSESGVVVKRALGRLAIYLRNRVEAPLLKGLDEGGAALQDGADEALGAVEDLEFFLEASDEAGELTSRELGELVGEVVEEFGDQSDVKVEVSGSREPIGVRVDVEGIKDAVFLILHNAAEFGDGKPVTVTLRQEGNRAVVRVRDQGPGFSADALMEALDPFYSTSPGGLGLGLPHARNAIQAQGGQILLRNHPGGGGEVEILLPRAE